MRNERGASIIEVMISMGVFAIATMVVLPFIVQGRKIARVSEFNDMCINAVRSKLHEYKFGAETTLDVSTTLTDEAGLYGNRNIGFSYAKSRYNSERNNYCPRDLSSTAWAPLSVASKPVPTNLAQLGREECISDIGTGGVPPTCTSPVDVSFRSNVRNFRLFVNLRRVNSILGREDCPWYDTSSSYDFQHAEDVMKVSVTGLIDLSSTFVFADISSASVRASELQCQVSDFIRPPSPPARYWMQNDGRIFRWQGTGDNSGNYEVFRSLASPNNLGFTVSPDNRFVYLLRPGVLIRYSGCTGDPIDCPINSQTTWQVDNNLATITAKWVMALGATEHVPNPTCGNPIDGLPVIFGLLNDRRERVCINMQADSTAAKVNLRYDSYNPGTGVTRIPFQVSNTGRVFAIFMDPRGLTTYALDLTCVNIIGQSNCAAIYDSNDTQMQYPLNVFSVRAIAFSK